MAGSGHELLAAWSILPLVFGKLADDAELLIASDATGSDTSGNAGLGVSLTNEIRHFERAADWGDQELQRMGWHRARWRWAVAMKVESKSHVNIHEMMGLLLAGEVGLSHGLPGHKDVPIFLVDNTAVVGAVNKGRSSSYGLNLLLRRWAAFLFTFQTWVVYTVCHVHSDVPESSRCIVSWGSTGSARHEK